MQKNISNLLKTLLGFITTSKAKLDLLIRYSTHTSLLADSAVRTQIRPFENDMEALQESGNRIKASSYDQFARGVRL